MSSLSSAPPPAPLGANTLLRQPPPMLASPGSPTSKGQTATADLAARMPTIPSKPMQPRPMQQQQQQAYGCVGYGGTAPHGFSLMSHSLSRTGRGDVFTPFNTPADAPPLMSGSIVGRSPIVPRAGPGAGAGSGAALAPAYKGSGRGGGISGGPAGGGARPIGGLAAIRGGRGGGAFAPHAITPGNTPSSLEKISRRMARNLSVDEGGQGPAENRIAPSYERRFRADLGDLEKRLQSHAEHHASSLHQSRVPESPPSVIQRPAALTSSLTKKDSHESKA